MRGACYTILIVVKNVKFRLLPYIRAINRFVLRLFVQYVGTLYYARVCVQQYN